MLQDLLSKQLESQNSRSLATTAKAQSYERKIAGQRHMVYDILASAAAFKAKVQAGGSISDPLSCHEGMFRYLDTWIFNDGEATMSISSKDSKVSFIVCTSNIFVVENADNVGMEILPRRFRLGGRHQGAGQSPLHRKETSRISDFALYRHPQGRP